MENDSVETYFLVRVLHTKDTILLKPPLLPLVVGDHVMVPTKYGIDLGIIDGTVKAANINQWEGMVDIVRPATPADLSNYEDNKAKEKEAYSICKQKIDAHKLDMKLVSVHMIFDEAKLVFFFSSENRVDFRDLVKDLVGIFHQRIELRQIGVRDEARMTGGVAVCGRALCCAAVGDKLQAVSIKMAKVQNLSLNSMKISGPCGRLLCCLAYEYETYRAERRELPPEGITLRIEGRDIQVYEVNTFTRKVRMRDGATIFEVPGTMFRSNEQTGQWDFVGKIPEPVENQHQ